MKNGRPSLKSKPDSIRLNALVHKGVSLLPTHGVARMNGSGIAWLRKIGFCEGISTLVLFCIAMPLKYVAKIPEAVTVVGSIHGVLFTLYVVAIVYVWYRYRWPFFRAATAAVAAIVPFGPFVFDASLRREQLLHESTQVEPASP